MRRTALLICWLLTDLILFIGAYAAAYFVRVGLILSTNFPLDQYLQAVAIIGPVWIAVMIQLGIFRLERVQSDKRNIAHILFACVMGVSLFTISYYFLFEQFFSRLLLIEAGVFSFAFTLIWHLAFDQWQRRILRKDPPAYPLLIIGTNRQAEKLIIHLNERQSPFKPMAILDCEGSTKKEVAGVPILGKLNRLEEVIHSLRPTHLVHCSHLEHTINLMSVCKQHRMTYLLLPSVLGAVGHHSNELIEGQPFIAVHQ